MRKHLTAAAVFCILILFVPLICVENSLPKTEMPDVKAVEQPAQAQPIPQEPSMNPAAYEESTPVVEEKGYFTVLDESSGKQLQISVHDYVRGALAAEMPPTFHPEALKAQAVAAHTYALCVQRMQEASPDDTLHGADFKADPANWRVCTTEEIFRERYGDLSEDYWKRITDAADAVENYVLLYEGQPIVAAYHSMSNGMTEDAANVWNGGVPYLTPVESRGDTLAPDFESKAAFTGAELAKTIQSAYPEADFSGPVSGWLREGERSESGYVLTVWAGGVQIPAAKLRTLLSLRSTDFTVASQGDSFVFTVRGYGHGVGFSQYGADYLGRQGMDFEEILAHYYPGTVLGVAKTAGK